MKKKTVIVLLIIISIFTLFFIFANTKIKTKTITLNGQEVNIPNIPKGNTHWHPRLTILIDGEKIQIPDDIGVRTGRIVDTDLSGMRMSPTHTHESDGTIHIENLNPAKKPETLTLGYFFYAWDKPFNATCIFEYCTDKGELKMFVNREENKEFENYFMHDKDDIVIEYSTN